MAFIRLYNAAGVGNPFDLFPGLTEDLLVEALRNGEAVRAEATALDAPMRGGSDAFFEKLRTIRVGLVAHGCGYSNEQNYCTVISPCGGHQIAIAAGTRGTGLPNARPETARPMGPVTGAIISVNRAQLDLFRTPTKEPAKMLTWLFLSYRERHPRGDRIYAELSLPEAQTDKRIVCKWRERYIIPPFDLTPDPFDVGSDSNEDAPRGVDVAVSLR